MPDNEVSVKVTAQTNEFNSEIKKAADEFKSFSNTIRESSEKLKGVFELLIAAFAVDKIAELEEHFGNLAEQINRTAQMTGLSAEAVQQFTFAVEMTGGSAESAATTITRLEKNMAEAATGTGQAALAFKDLGIQVTDSNGKIRPLQSVLGDLAEKFKNSNDGATKTAYALQLMGRGGAELIPVLNKGKEGLEELNEELEKTGGRLTSGQLEAFQRLDDGIKMMNKSWEGFKLAVASLFEPAAEKIVQWLTKIIQLGTEAAKWVNSIGYAKYAPINQDGTEDSGGKNDLKNPSTEQSVSEARKIAQEKIKQMQLARREQILIGQENDKQELEMQQITKEEYLKRAYDAQIALDKIEIDGARQRLEAVKGNAAEEAAAQTQLDNVKMQSRVKELQASNAIQAEQRKTSLENFKTMFDSFNTGLQSMTEKLIRGTATWKEAFRSMCADMIVSFAKMQVANVAKALWAAAISKEISIKQMILERSANAVKAATGAWSSTVGIPIVGPVLAPIAAAGAFAGVMAFGMPSAAGGWDEVPRDSLAMVHKKEMVLPAPLAEKVRNMADPGTSTSPVYNVNISAVDARSFKDMVMRSPEIIAQAIQGQSRNLNPAAPGWR
jgi:TP901 family phage tail tape measure protein